jgi:hypothetical protein
MKTAGRENPNRRAIVPGAEHMARKVRTDPAQSSGLRSRKSFSQWGWCFFLDFFLYRTFHVLPTHVKILLDLFNRECYSTPQVWKSEALPKVEPSVSFVFVFGFLNKEGVQ